MDIKGKADFTSRIEEATDDVDMIDMNLKDQEEETKQNIGTQKVLLQLH